MHPLWKGAISFGLVHIPVKLYAATVKKDIKFNLLHEPCLTPIHYQKHCTTCDRPVNQEEIVLGYEYQRGQYIVLGEEDLNQLPRGALKTVEITAFVPLAEVDPIYFDKSYYLEPVDGGQKAYALLIRAMEESKKVAVARVVIRTKESLALIRVREGVLLLETMFYHEEIRSPGELNMAMDKMEVEARELKMAINLINSLSGKFQPEKYQNEYRQSLRELISAKIAGQEVRRPAAAETGKVVDLMEALKASIKMAEENRGQAKKPPVKKPKAKRKTS